MHCLQCVSVVALQRPTRSQDHRPHRDELASQGWEGGVGERGFELEIGVITRYRNRHSLKIFPPPRPEVAFGAPLLTFATRGMGEEGVAQGQSRDLQPKERVQQMSHTLDRRGKKSQDV